MDGPQVQKVGIPKILVQVVCCKSESTAHGELLKVVRADKLPELSFVPKMIFEECWLLNEVPGCSQDQ